MIYKVLLGSVRTDKGTFFVGEQFELSEKEGIALVREGVVELVEIKQSQVPPKKEEQPVKRTTRPSKKAQKEEKKEVEANLSEPSLDWTISELTDYAEEKGIEIPLDAEKEQILEAIKGGEVK